MIKAEYKGTNIEAEVAGDSATVLAELTCAAKSIYEEIEKVRGKKVADEKMKRVFKGMLMSEEELNKEYEVNKALLQENISEFMNGLLTGGTK